MVAFIVAGPFCSAFGGGVVDILRCVMHPYDNQHVREL